METESHFILRECLSLILTVTRRASSFKRNDIVKRYQQEKIKANFYSLPKVVRFCFLFCCPFGEMGPPGGNVMLRLLFRQLKSHRSDLTDEVIINLLVYFYFSFSSLFFRASFESSHLFSFQRFFFFFFFFSLSFKLRGENVWLYSVMWNSHSLTRESSETISGKEKKSEQTNHPSVLNGGSLSCQLNRVISFSFFRQNTTSLI
jgi:hypothetical protein